MKTFKEYLKEDEVDHEMLSKNLTWHDMAKIQAHKIHQGYHQYWKEEGGSNRFKSHKEYGHDVEETSRETSADVMERAHTEVSKLAKHYFNKHKK